MERLATRRFVFYFAAATALCPGQLNAFQNGQHQNISQTAISNIGTDYPDIQKFGPLITAWSWGIGPQSALPGFVTGNPAEQLAHLLDQTQDIAATGNIDGGNYNQILLNINTAYMNQDFSTQAAGQEGAYVWMGAACHLIEDQASPPHATNILHDLGDNFEGPASNAGFKTLSFPFSSNLSAGVQLGAFYSASLNTTQAKIPFLNPVTAQNPAGVQLWLFNDQATGISGKSSCRYGNTNCTAGGLSQFGEYGGIQYNLSDQPSPPSATSPFFLFPFAWSTPADIYSEPTAPTSIFTNQSAQAADFTYNFLIQMSKSLPPQTASLTMAGAGTGAPAIVNRQTGSQIAFGVTENRTQNVKVDLFIKETGDRIVSGDTFLSLVDAGNPAGQVQTLCCPRQSET